MPKRLTIEDYRQYGEEHDLDFIGEIYDPDQLERMERDVNYLVVGDIPDSALTPTNWRCKLTGKIINKRVSAVYRSEYGSRYQRTFEEEKTIKKYLRLAQKLGIEFLWDPETEFFPATTKDKCRWRGPDGNVFYASYHDLGYGVITSTTASRIGLTAEERTVHYGL